MSKYKTGDKVVLEIIQDDSYGDYKVGNETHFWWNSHELLDKVAEPLSEYTEPLEVEASRLIKENAKLKAEIESAEATGQQEAWELARKIICSPGYSISELKEIFGSKSISWCISCNTYNEAAAKVAEWEQKKEEICVGDMLLSNRTSNKCVVTYIGCELITVLWDDGSCSNKPKNFIREGFKKIGHIDVASMLAQIGGEE